MLRTWIGQVEANVSSDSTVQDLLDPERLMEHYGERIYRLARRMSNNESDAEDVMQNTLIKILRKAESYRGESDPMGWIYRITLNEAREVHRRRKRRPSVSLDSLPVDFESTGHTVDFTDVRRRPEKAAMAGEIDQRIRDAIDELPDGYREAVILHDLEGVPYQEAAELMEVGLGAFKTRLHRARLYLRQKLEQFWRDYEQGAPSPNAGGAR